jgi:N-acetylmuramoyl-L-alanine amidase
MKRKTQKWMLLLLAVCLVLTGIACYRSANRKEDAQDQVTRLESEVEALQAQVSEQAAKETETEEEIIEETTVETESEHSSETETSSEIETDSGTEALQETESEEIPDESGQSNGYTVAIDPGHQGSWVDMSAQEPSAPGSGETKAKATTGTQGRYSGVPEYQLNLDISLALRTELENRGYRVILTREDNDTAISNAERALKAYDEGGDIYVRIHANGSDDTSVNGALGMTPSYDNAYVGYLAEDSYRLTECILNAYCAETGFASLGIQYHDDMTGINWSKLPVMILEMGFMTNQSDDLAMEDPAMQEKMVTGIANGIDEYFGR